MPSLFPVTAGHAVSIKVTAAVSFLSHSYCDLSESRRVMCGCLGGALAGRLPVSTQAASQPACCVLTGCIRDSFLYVVHRRHQRLDCLCVCCLASLCVLPRLDCVCLCCLASPPPSLSLSRILLHDSRMSSATWIEPPWPTSPSVPPQPPPPPFPRRRRLSLHPRRPAALKGGHAPLAFHLPALKISSQRSAVGGALGPCARRARGLGGDKATEPLRQRR